MEASKINFGTPRVKFLTKAVFLRKKKRNKQNQNQKQKLFVTVRLGLFLMRVNNCSCVQIDKEI